jgi:hypothetical protein
MADVVAVQLTPIFLFVSLPQPLVRDSISVATEVGISDIVLTPIEAIIDAQWFATIQATTFPLVINPLQPFIDVFVPRSRSIARRINRTAWQARLAAKLDPIKRKVVDNNLIHTGFPTEMLRIKTVRDPRTHDVLTRTVVSNEVLPITFPELKDMPIRRLGKDERDETIILSMDAQQDGSNSLKMIEAYCPLEAQLERDDLLIRIWQEPSVDLPYVTVLQVKDELATFTTNSILFMKYKLTMFDEQLPQTIINTVVDAARKRGNLKW